MTPASVLKNFIRTMRDSAVKLIDKRIHANVVKMFNFIRVTLFLAATVNAALSPSSIDSDLSIIIHNDLLGTSLLSYEND